MVEHADPVASLSPSGSVTLGMGELGGCWLLRGQGQQEGEMRSTRSKSGRLMYHLGKECARLAEGRASVVALEIEGGREGLPPLLPLSPS